MRPLKGRDLRQQRAFDWARAAFGDDCVGDLQERVTRILEEALELAQAEGLDEERAMFILKRVFDRPPGDPQQELGGIGVTMLVYAESKGTSVDACEWYELNRVLNKPLDHFKQRHAEKYALGMTTKPAKEST